ncbi:MAG TPA: LAGLIDADG family homing endonuclease [Candidatus Thermoplasmatota archaeon]|nr:LAGLIDADG family homing endonuclease [Candidatus Thermoplasmatota archaeon]
MGTTLTSQSLVAAWEQFLTDYYKGRIEEAALNYPDTRSVDIDYNDIDRRDPNLAQYTLDHPRASIQSAEEAAKLIEVPVEPRPFLRMRIRNVPRVNRYMIRKLRAEHLGKFVAIEGLIKKVVEVRPKLRDATFQCQRCGAVFNVTQEDQVLTEPKSCDEGQGGCGRDGPFRLLTEESKFIDSQKLEIQESHEDLRGGAQPERITVYLEEDLTGRLYPGDSIIINGIFRAQQRRQGSLKLAEFIKVVDCNSFEVQKFEFEEIDIRPEDVPEITQIAANKDPYTLIRQSFAPELFGMDDVKDALILSLFGGVAKEFVDGTRIRGDIHVLLVGDPGVAKSQSLRYLAKLSPRSIYTSGKGSSAAGLTATAVRDEFGEGQWSLEAGALVLADKGIACLHPDSEVIVDNRPTKIGSLFDETKAQTVQTKSGRLLEISQADFETPNLNLDTLMARKARATLVTRRMFKGELIRAKLASGFELRMTPDHLVLDGATLRWKRLGDAGVGDRLVAAQKIPGHSDPVPILSIMPDHWVVRPDRDETQRLVELMTASGDDRPSKAALKGRRGLSVASFRDLLTRLNADPSWWTRPYRYGPVRASRRLRIGSITPQLAYVSGFLFGDGHLAKGRYRGRLNLYQADVNHQHLASFASAIESVTDAPWRGRPRTTEALIRGAKARSTGTVLGTKSIILTHIHEWITGNGLGNLQRLDDEALAAFVAGAMDSDGCISVRRDDQKAHPYRNVAISFALSNDSITNERFMMALRRLDVFSRLRQKTGVKHVEITSREDGTKLLTRIAPYASKWTALPKALRGASADHEEVARKPLQKILRRINVRPSVLLRTGDWSAFHGFRAGTRRPFKNSVRRLSLTLGSLASTTDAKQLAALTGADHALDAIVALTRESYEGPVFDLRVPEGAHFLSSGIASHNCIDEMDKMEETDQSAMHQAMEQQEISISKAGISATLKSRCAVIGAANPKTGRFDDYTPIVQQINMPPPLLSRFDLIFSMRDKPNKEQDELIARHILGTHRAGEVHEQRLKFPEGNFSEAQEKLLMARIQPAIDEKMFRKYVAYAKRNYFPVMTDEAAEKINTFYQTLRNQATGVIGITPRQIEALIRLTEASARIRLSNVATGTDAERAVRIFTTYLKTVGWDAEAGAISIDIIAAGASSSQQDRMRRVLEIIRRLHGESGGEGAKLADIEKEAQSTVPPISADKIGEAIKILKERGSIFQPRSDRFAPL